MKLRLPKSLFAAVLAACAASFSAVAETTTSSESYTLGDVMYVGDSITHGEDSASYRWALHKILVDNGITYNEVGIKDGNANGGIAVNTVYRGVTFKNKHSAHTSGRAWEVSGRQKGSRYNGTNIKNWLGLSSEITGSTNSYTGSTYTPDTFFMLLGTNDLLSDSHSGGLSANLTTVTETLLGDVEMIIDTMYQANSQATVYVATVPCWTNHSNNNDDVTHQAVAKYNESYKQWVSDYNKENNTSIVLVDINRGILDVASEKPFYGVFSMFNRADGQCTILWRNNDDGLHPNSQGDLIIAGNMARAMGIGGRTAGAERKAAASFTRVVNNVVTDGVSNLKLTANTPSLSFSWSDSDPTLTPAGGYTAELMGFTFGNGAVNKWNTEDNFSFTIGNGSSYGTLEINEAYIQWNGSVVFSNNGTQLFSYDMSTLTENIRMAYVVGVDANGIAGGYYVWVGDMLIGEALTGTTSADAVNGVTLSYSGSSCYTLQGLALDATGTYAPTIGLFNAAPADGSVVVPDNVTLVEKGVDTTVGHIYATNETAGITGDVWVKVTKGQATSWAGAKSGKGKVSGNITMIFSDNFKGSYADGATTPGNTAGTVFGAVNGGDVEGNVTVQFDAKNAQYGSFTNTNSASVIGSYESNITGVFKAVINAGTFYYDILGGIQTDADNSNSIGATDIYINGGTIKGAVYGGGVAGTINGDSAVNINGGTIDGSIYGGGKGGTIKGNTAVTISGNTAALKGSVISAGGTSGSIDGNSTVTIKNVSTDGAVEKSIASFTGTLTGGSNVKGTSTLVFENAHLTGNPTVEHFDAIALSVASDVALGNTSLTGGTATVSLADASELTINGNFTTAGGLNVTGGSGTLKLSGTTNTFGGTVAVAAGNSLTVGRNVVFTGIELPGLTYSYDEEYAQTATTNGLGRAIVTGLTIQDLFSGDGEVSFSQDSMLTVNDLNLGYAVDLSANSSFTVENEIYYVINSTKMDAPERPVAARPIESTDRLYSLANGTEVLRSTVVHVGSHEYSGPLATEGANEAGGFYVGENGVLCIMSDAAAGLAGDILETTQGSGDIILRSPGYKDIDGELPTITVEVDSQTKVTGSLYLAPYEIDSGGSVKQSLEQPGVFMHLENNADISSFKSVHYGYPQSQIVVKGQIGANAETGAHINNLTAVGCGTVYFAIDAGANEDLVLGGATTLGFYEHGDGSKQGSTVYFDVNHENSHITIESLEGGVSTSGWHASNLYFTTHSYDNYDYSLDSRKGEMTIESFDYRGYIYLKATNAADSLAMSINLNSEQYLYDTQITALLSGADGKPPYEGQYGVTLKGDGKYILSAGQAIYMPIVKHHEGDYQRNFAKLSTEYAADGTTRIWTGTVEVNNLVAVNAWSDTTSTLNGLDFDDYGNEQSTIHFKGFRGHIFNTTAGDAYKNINIVSDIIFENSSTMNAFEISNGYGGQKLNFKGDISGTGDVVISLSDTNGTPSETLNFSGDISGWKAEGDEKPEILVKKATQAVNFTGAATEINVDMRATGGTMNVGISNDAAVTVNSEIRHEGNGVLNVTVDTAEGTTFNNTLDVDKLAVKSGGVALIASGVTATAGTVSMQAKDTRTAAKLSGGMTVSSNTVAGGRAENTVFCFEGDGSVSNASLEDSTLSSIKDGASVSLAGVTAKDVYLAGRANFVALGAQETFKHGENIVAWGKSYNEVEFSTTSFEGMILEQSMVGTITLSVDNAVTDWDNADAAALTNVTILLKGFRVEGMQDGQRVDEWFSPLNIETAAMANATLLADTGSMTVEQLMNPDAYAFTYYEQTAQGLIIRMSNIPEPTTATLSLLALAALAARRRRR